MQDGVVPVPGQETNFPKVSALRFLKLGGGGKNVQFTVSLDSCPPCCCLQGCIPPSPPTPSLNLSLGPPLLPKSHLIFLGCQALRIGLW